MDHSEEDQISAPTDNGCVEADEDLNSTMNKDDSANEMGSSRERLDNSSQIYAEMLVAPIERRNNELKALLLHTAHAHHAAQNAIRVSRKYIDCLYSIIENLTNTRNNNLLASLRNEAFSCDEELGQWENLFAESDVIKSLIDAFSEPMGHTDSRRSLHVLSNLINGDHPTANGVSSQRSSITQGTTSSVSHSSNRENRRPEPSNMVPSEMLELSLQTSNEDHLSEREFETEDSLTPISFMSHDLQSTSHGHHGSSQNFRALASSIMKKSEINSQLNSLSERQFFSARSDNSMSSSHNNAANNVSFSEKKQVYTCDYENCDFQTQSRQRMIMHGRSHTGTQLFYCETPGCDYFTNFKGNLKIHKKHKHREVTPAQEGVPRRGRKRKTDSSGLDQSIDEQNGDATFESSSNDSRLDKDDRNIVKYNYSSNSYVCHWEGCDWNTKWKQLVEPHIFGHIGKKPFKCDVAGCNYETNYKNNVKLHKKRHYKGPNGTSASAHPIPTQGNSSGFVQENNPDSNASSYNNYEMPQSCDFEAKLEIEDNFEHIERRSGRSRSGNVSAQAGDVDRRMSPKSGNDDLDGAHHSGNRTVQRHDNHDMNSVKQEHMSNRTSSPEEDEDEDFDVQFISSILPISVKPVLVQNGRH